MFYSQFVLAKKGPLGRIWLAAHWEKKLSKSQIYNTNITKSVASISESEVPMALRMSGHLLLGVVRIYSRQVKYLLDDCSEALVKIKMAFRPGSGTVDMAPDVAVAKKNAITLQLDYGEADESVSSADVPLDNFGDEIESQYLDFDQYRSKKNEITEQFIEPDSPIMSEDEDLGAPLTPGTPGDIGLTPEERRAGDMGDIAGFETPDDLSAIDDFGEDPMEVPGFQDLQSFEETPGRKPSFMLDSTPGLEDIGSGQTPGFSEGESMGEPPAAAEAPRGIKRKQAGPIVDDATQLSADYMKNQIKDTASLVRDLELAPPTKRAMLEKERELVGVESLFTLANIPGLPEELQRLFQRNMSDKSELPAGTDESDEFPGPTGWEETEAPSFIQEDEFGAGFGEDGVIPGSPIIGSEEHSEVEGEEEEGEDDDDDDEEWNERTKRMHNYLTNSFSNDQAEVSYHGMIEGKDRRTASGTFFELLVLKSRGYIDLKQDAPYADITVNKTDKFYEPIPEIAAQ